MRLGRKTAARLLIALVGSAALLLGGCRADSTLEFKADGSARTEIVFEGDVGSAETYGGDCANFEIHVPASGKFFDEARVENLTKPGGPFTCKATWSTPALRGNDIYGVHFKRKGNSYSLAYRPFPTRQRVSTNITVRTTIIMPGKILKTNTGTIQGNKVIIDGTGYLKDGFQITSEANRAGNGDADSSHSAKNTPPLWMWVLIGAGVLTAIVGASAFSVRKENADFNRADADLD